MSFMASAYKVRLEILEQALGEWVFGVDKTHRACDCEWCQRLMDIAMEIERHGRIRVTEQDDS
jgi:hypothetical protein